MIKYTQKPVKVTPLMHIVSNCVDLVYVYATVWVFLLVLHM